MQRGDISPDGTDGTALRGRQSKGKPPKESLKFRRVFRAALRTQSIISKSTFCQESLQNKSFSPTHAAFGACDILIRTALVKKPQSISQRFNVETRSDLHRNRVWERIQVQRIQHNGNCTRNHPRSDTTPRGINGNGTVRAFFDIGGCLFVINALKLGVHQLQIPPVLPDFSSKKKTLSRLKKAFVHAELIGTTGKESRSHFRGTIGQTNFESHPCTRAVSDQPSTDNFGQNSDVFPGTQNVHGCERAPMVVTTRCIVEQVANGQQARFFELLCQLRRKAKTQRSIKWIHASACRRERV